jgi:hypothetical protein
VPRFNGAFCYVSVAINDLKVRRSPIAEQFWPSLVAMVAPDPKQRHSVIYLGILPEPSTGLSASPRLQPPQQRRFAAWGIPEFPCDHTGAVPSRILVRAGTP